MNYNSIGTTSNVRDIVTMADALYGSDKDINFYGISYGTYMGMILTQLYPDRVGKVILDGIFPVFVTRTESNASSNRQEWSILKLIRNILVSLGSTNKLGTYQNS
jgi:pimeloyl-ACP methyl ester carboxylesterase